MKDETILLLGAGALWLLSKKTDQAAEAVQEAPAQVIRYVTGGISQATSDVGSGVSKAIKDIGTTASQLSWLYNPKGAVIQAVKSGYAAAEAAKKKIPPAPFTATSSGGGGFRDTTPELTEFGKGFNPLAIEPQHVPVTASLPESVAAVAANLKAIGYTGYIPSVSDIPTLPKKPVTKTVPAPVGAVPKKSTQLYENQPPTQIVETYKSGAYMESYWLGGEQYFRMVYPS